MSDERTVLVRFKGPEDEVVIHRTGQAVKKGETVEVPEEVAHGREAFTGKDPDNPLDPGDPAYKPALGGLLDQQDKWELAEKAAPKGKPAAVTADEEG